MIRLALAAIRHHAGLVLGLVLTVALSTALLTGGLATGDALRAALAARTAARLGPVDVVVQGRPAGFRAALGRAVAEATGAGVAGVLWREGVAAGPEGAARRVDVVGADGDLAALAGFDDLVPEPGVVRFDADLAAALGVAPGDRVVLRVERPSALSRESALTKDEGRIVGLSAEVGPLLDGRWPTDLALDATPGVPDVVLVDRGWLAARLGLGDRVDRLLVAGADADAVRRAVDAAWTLEDAGLAVVAGAEPALVAERVLLPEGVGAAAAAKRGVPGLVWLVDAARLGDRVASYVFVGGVPPEAGIGVAAALPDDLGDDEIVITDWMAEDLGARPGDVLTLRYPVLGSARAVSYGEASLRVRAVLPLEGALADPTWMPPIEGLADQQDCRAWDPGLPVDLQRITDRDEAYWDLHRGTPRAWVSLATAQRLWAGPDGDLTTVRFPGAGADVETSLREALDASVAALRVLPVRERLVAAETPANDFGALFAGFQMVLLAAAWLLVALQAGFAVEHRARELGALRALGFPRARLARLVGTEVALVLVAGGLLGLPLAWGVAAAIARGLDGVWAGAVSGTALEVVVTPATLCVGMFGSQAACALAVAAATRRQLAREPRALLAGVWEEGGGKARGATVLAVGAGVLAVVVALVTPPERTPVAAGAFFTAGALVLVAVAAGARAALGRGVGGPLGIGASARRPGRALAVVGVLGAGAFLVAGVGLGGGRPVPDATRRDGGTGGFALFGETTLPLLHRLDDPDGAAALALPSDLLPPGSVVPLRRLDGDDASCVQLGSAQTPTLYGVEPAALRDRGAFTAEPAVWDRLRDDLGPGRLAAIGDAPTVTWGLHLGVGDAVTWIDEAGRPVEVVIVGVIGGSVLQGGLIVDEAALRRHFPTSATVRTVLVDVPRERAADVARTLERALADVGATFVSTEARLARFGEVEETYVAIFRALGGLGLLLGAAGVGLVLARSVEERRAELAALRAVGFPRRRVVALLVAEHAAPVVVGLLGGALGAAVAVVPVIASGEAEAPWGEVAAVLAGTGLVAWAALRIAASRALSGVPLRELVRERT